MSKKIVFILLITFTALLAACAADEKEAEDDLSELPELAVDFDVPEQVEAGETIDLTAHVTYDGEAVTDADGVKFEVWTQGNSEDSVYLEGVHQQDGTYTASFTFEEEAVYEMYAHTDAKDMHVMPLATVIVGDAEVSEEDAHDEMDHEHHESHEDHDSDNEDHADHKE